MKLTIILIAALFFAISSSAQTNKIVFEKLLSPTNSVLMTNAEFRLISGDTIIFLNDVGYQKFHASDLNTNVLAALHVTAGGLELAQKELDLKNANYRVWYAKQVAAHQAALAEQKSQKLSAEQAARQMQIEWLHYQANHGRTGWDGHQFNDNQSIGNFIGN